ncbi:MAG: YwaF family protein [Firmicutes bacterium]|nr:YwaF family protein [Bacillota bacterium]
MDFFWDTVETVDRAKCDGFSHFDTGHIIWLVFFLCVAAVCTRFYLDAGEGRGSAFPNCRRRIRIVFAVLLIIGEVLKYVVVAKAGVPLAGYLPLQLCSISVILVIVHALLPVGSGADADQRPVSGVFYRYIGNFLYLIGLPAGLAALLFPSWTALPILANFMSLHSFTTHILLVTYVAMLVAAKEIRPEIRTVPVCVCALIVMAIGVYFFDVSFNMNFMYLVHLSPASPIAPFASLGDYRIGYAVILAALILILYGVPALVRRTSSR